MTRQRNSTDRGADDRYRRDQILYEWQLNSLARFRLFFAGLVFAVLAFSIQFSVEAPETVVRWLQILGWLALLASGILALRDAGGFVGRYTEEAFGGLGPKTRWCMWGLFVVGIGFLGVARSWPTTAS